MVYVFKDKNLKELENKIIDKLNEEYILHNFDNVIVLKTNQQIEFKEATMYDDSDLIFASNKYVKETSKISVDNEIFNDEFKVIAGPCSVESYEQMESVVKFLVSKNIKYIRGGLSKPRSSVYSFQGLESKGVEIIKQLKEKYDFKFVSEIVDKSQIEEYTKVVDVIQIGARNMQNFELLKAVGKANIPVLLKRGMSATISEFLNAAEYIMANGNKNVILCERGIRTFESSYRNVLDLNAVIYLKNNTHLPVIVDPSHGGGIDYIVEKLSLASSSIGSDGLIIEVHENPSEALSDADQALDFDTFENTLNKINKINEIIGK